MAWGQPSQQQQQQQATISRPQVPHQAPPSGAATTSHHASAAEQQHYPAVNPATADWSAGSPNGTVQQQQHYPPSHGGVGAPPAHYPASDPYMQQQHPQEGAPGGPAAGHLQVEIPGLAPQPWVRDLWSWLATNTVGVARVDLLRPTPPSLDQYRGNNLLFASYKQRSSNTLLGATTTGTWRPFRAPQPAAPSYHHPSYQPRPTQQTAGQGGPGYRNAGAAPAGYYPPVPPAQQRGQAAVRPGRQVVEQQQQAYGAYPYPQDVQEEVVVATEPPGPARGARVKITRSFMFWKDQRREGRPMMDFGGGINIDMDRGRVEPVLRLKLGQVLSLRAFPRPSLKMSGLVPLGRTGMGLKVHFDVPLDSLHRFYQPPARLMLRLDPLPGSGVRLTPTGVELDQTSMRFGQSITMRASAGLNFPRTLPIDPENDDLGLKVHRLSLKALW